MKKLNEAMEKEEKKEGEGQGKPETKHPVKAQKRAKPNTTLEGIEEMMESQMAEDEEELLR